MIDFREADWPRQVVFYYFPDNLAPAWKACIADWLRSLYYDGSQSESTLVGYSLTLIQFWRLGFTLDSVTSSDIERFRYAPTNRGAIPSGSTRNMRRVVLASLLKFARRWHPPGSQQPLYQQALPTDECRTAKTNRNHTQFSEEELRAFFHAIDQECEINPVRGARDKLLFTTYYLTSRRAREVRFLRYGMIEPATFTEKDGTSRTGKVYCWRGKGRGNILDHAEWPSTCDMLLDRYLEVSGRAESIRPDHYIFIAAPALGYGHGGYPSSPYRCLDDTTVWASCDDYCKRAGIAHKSPHAFRHTSSRHRFEAGQDVLSLSAHLRHSSIAVTDVYLSELVSGADAFSTQLAHRLGY
jgi:integrase